MAERLKHKFLEEEKMVDLVVGPDAYKDIPNLLKEIDQGREAVNVILSKEETYGDISPVRLATNGVSALLQLQGVVIICVLSVLFLSQEEENAVEIQKYY